VVFFKVFRIGFRALLKRSHAAKYAACVVLACVAAVVVAMPVFGQTTPVTLVGAGDIADCGYANDEGTAQLLGNTLRSLTPDHSLPSLNQARAIAMGDNAYPRANRNQYANCYDNYNLDSSFSTFDPSRPDWWGHYKDQTMPVLGNHEYLNTDDPSTQSQPYFDYFGAQNGFKGPAAPVPNDPGNNHGLKFGEGYYSYDLGSWHIVALNSNCGKVGGCDASSPQGRWLQRDLANHPAQCTLAYFHHPLYATANGTNTLDVRPFWDMLYAAGADVILSGHAHRYELHAPMTPEGELDPTTGIRQLVVGTGGEPGGGEVDANQVPQGVLQKVIIDKFGVIKLDLNSPDNAYPKGSYSWAFIAVDGTANGTVLDSGSDQCHGVPGSPGTTQPTVTNVVPGNGASDVPIGSKVEATFSKAMDQNTINGSTFTLSKPDGPDSDTNPDPVLGTVAYDSTSNKATLSPSANLAYGTTYTATVKGGTSGVKDTAGNPLSADEVWTFTTKALPAPSNLSATRSGSPTKQRIDLTWTDNSSSEAGFVIERSTTSSFTANLVTYQEPTNTTSNSDSSVQNKTTYYYRVFAVDSTGTRSTPSNVASAPTK
jgi:Bacterial Ig-like domain/Calcineurin-like phosphoesterase